MRAAVLDLGSNSFHVLVADLDGHRITPVLRQRDMRHLGRVVRQHGAVPDDEVAASAATVAHLAELARRAGAEELIAVATAALRDADNGAEVMAAFRDAAGVDIQVVDGVEEARLAYLGVRASVAVRAEPLLVLDLGGGSLEFAIGGGPEVTWAVSTPLGASALSADVPDGALRKRHIRMLHEIVDTSVDPRRDAIAAAAPASTVAVGGTVRALGRVLAAAEDRWLPATVNQARIERDALTELAARLAASTLDERREIAGVSSRRADHIHVAAIVLARVMERLDLEVLSVSDWGLREGVLLDAHGVAEPPDPDALRDQEVRRLQDTFSPDDPHPDHAAGLAGRLFDATTDLHGLAAPRRDTLVYAARLHAIGESIALRKQQRHGAYLLEHAELRGFAPAEAAMLTTLVRFHPSRGVGRRFPAFESLTSDERSETVRLLALLQLADGLDRAHDQAVTDLRTADDGNTVEIHLDGGGLHAASDELARRARLFTEVFDRRVVIHDHANGNGNGGRDHARPDDDHRGHGDHARPDDHRGPKGSVTAVERPS